MEKQIQVQEQKQLSEQLAQEYGMRQDVFLNVIKKTVMPSPNVSNEHIAAFLSLSKSYGLNPLSDAIHAFPNKGGIKLLIGIDGYIEIANQHKAYEGFELEENHDPDGNLIAVSCRVHRSDRKHSHWIKEYMDECKRNTDPWKNFPKRMLRHKAIMQAVRSSFGLSSLIDVDEAKDMGYDANGIKVINTPTTPLTERLTASPGNVTVEIKDEEKPLPVFKPETVIEPPASIPFEVEPEPAAATESLADRLSEDDKFESAIAQPTQQSTQPSWTLNKATAALKQCKSAEGTKDCRDRHQAEWDMNLTEGELSTLERSYVNQLLVFTGEPIPLEEAVA